MGIFSSKEVVEGVLTPLAPGELLVFGERFVVPEGKSMMLRLKSRYLIEQRFKFKVNDLNAGGEAAFVVMGSPDTDPDEGVHLEKLIVADETEQQIFYLQEKTLQGDRGLTIYKNDGSDMFKVTHGLGNDYQWTKDLVDVHGRPLTINSTLNMLAGAGDVWLGEAGTGSCIAKMYNPTTLPKDGDADGGWDSDDYFIEIAPGVDAALVLAVVIAFAEIDRSFDS